MKVMVVGLGSMGKRRIRLLHQYFPEHSLIGVDTRLERRQEVKEQYGIDTFQSIAGALESDGVEAAFICTAPLAHAKIITQCLENKLHIFTEINLVADDYEKNIVLAEQVQKTLFLSSTMLYREELCKVREAVRKCNDRLCYQYHVGQYLPDWHPWEDYKNFFVHDKRTNGCREILAIELPWMIKTFGPIETMKIEKAKVSNLDITYEDCYMILMQHKNGNLGSFVVELVAREAVRELRIMGENLFIAWSGQPQTLHIKNCKEELENKPEATEDVIHCQGYNKTITENAYVAEIEQFFAEVRKEKETVYGFREDLEILQYINKMEEV